jgi:hypothetical protein
VVADALVAHGEGLARGERRGANGGNRGEGQDGGTVQHSFFSFFSSSRFVFWFDVAIRKIGRSGRAAGSQESKKVSRKLFIPHSFSVRSRLKKVMAITIENAAFGRSEIARARDAEQARRFTAADPLLCAAESEKFPAVRKDGRKAP